MYVCMYDDDDDDVIRYVAGLPAFNKLSGADKNELIYAHLFVYFYAAQLLYSYIFRTPCLGNGAANNGLDLPTSIH